MSPDPDAVAPLDKIALRTVARLRRRALAAADPNAAHSSAARLVPDRLPPYAVIGGYRPMGAELDPGPTLSRLSARGAAIGFPHLAGDTMTFVDEHRRAIRPDLILAPLLAFDRRGGRLGQGGGHYDRCIAGLRASGSVFMIGLAYAGQEAPLIPVEAHDQRLDAILTELGYEAF